MTANKPQPETDLSEWERAYREFESPEQEIQKVLKRLRRLGIERWNKDLRILELFCGSGSGLLAWSKLGFQRVLGLDLSFDLLRRFQGLAGRCVGDARFLPLASQSRDVICIQGGLHHLSSLTDLDQVLQEIQRVLCKDGFFVVVEPWETPFLKFVHAACKVTLLRRCWPRLDMLARMVELEGQTYRSWLDQPQDILRRIEQRFEIKHRQIGWGKLMLVAVAPPSSG